LNESFFIIYSTVMQFIPSKDLRITVIKVVLRMHSLVGIFL